MSKHFLDSRQAAPYFGLSESQFRRNVASGILKVRAVLIQGKHKRQRFYLREDVEAAVKNILTSK